MTGCGAERGVSLAELHSDLAGVYEVVRCGLDLGHDDDHAGPLSTGAVFRWPGRHTPEPDLTGAERKALDLTRELFDTLATEVVQNGPTRDQDLRELAALLHPIQAVIMSQPTARRHPSEFRVLGGEIL